MTGELPVPVPGAEVASTLRAVEARIATVLDDLEADWRELAGQASEVLGEHDIPALVRHSARGGKRVRPQMVHWGWVAAGAPPQAFEQVVDLCAALELLHAFALVHDDVMDGSQLRRGAPSVHAMVAGTTLTSQGSLPCALRARHGGRAPPGRRRPRLSATLRGAHRHPGG